MKRKRVRFCGRLNRRRRVGVTSHENRRWPEQTTYASNNGSGNDSVAWLLSVMPTRGILANKSLPLRLRLRLRGASQAHNQCQCLIIQVSNRLLLSVCHDLIPKTKQTHPCFSIRSLQHHHHRRILDSIAILDSTQRPKKTIYPHLHHSTLATMCQTETFKSHTCPHQWMTIVKPCGPEASFRNQYHTYKPARSGLKKFAQPGALSAPANSCPNCDKKGEYDANMTRIIIEKPWEAGNMGNGYNMTDGRGNVLHTRFAPGGHGPPGARYTACGVSRTRVHPQQPWEQNGCCMVM
ncbi:hypothetical protein PV04_01651 [Phialophora macrospora]|uniref:Uncharacterized protein n=1 Tax=Phialophora macrospora TaxID=1851006 RepID=A0A0D2GMF1_9EURO|nr:hypothetical protein PV04_01651 [Phialophora macrospora]